MVVSKEDYIPLFHLNYQGNLQDVTVFRKDIGQIKERMQSLGLSQDTHTLVFDRYIQPGETTQKKNLDIVNKFKFSGTGRS